MIVGIFLLSNFSHYLSNQSIPTFQQYYKKDDDPLFVIVYVLMWIITLALTA